MDGKTAYPRGSDGSRNWSQASPDGSRLPGEPGEASASGGLPHRVPVHQLESLQQAGRAPDAHGIRPLCEPFLHHCQPLFLESGRCAGKQIEEGDVLSGEAVACLERPADPSSYNFV